MLGHISPVSPFSSGAGVARFGGGLDVVEVPRYRAIDLSPSRNQKFGDWLLTGHQRNRKDSVSVVPVGDGWSWEGQAVSSLPVLSSTVVTADSLPGWATVTTAVVSHR
jgi:hypothetical protein